MLFSVITKNLNWEILTKNLVKLDESTGKDNTDMIKISYSRTIVGRGFLAPLFYEDSLNCILSSALFAALFLWLNGW